MNAIQILGLVVLGAIIFGAFSGVSNAISRILLTKHLDKE
jgi:hypothetical protein